MASSGTGNSHDADYRKCQQLYLRRHRQGWHSRESTVAPPLLIGEAVHKYCEVFINAWMAGPAPFEVAKEEAMHAFNDIVGHPDPDNIDMLERESLARGVLPLWANRKWQRLDSGAEIPVATELQLQLDLPYETKYGPIRVDLRHYTAKIDYLYEEQGTNYLVVSDHKGTKASAPAKEVKHYMMSDQHIGYVACVNEHADIITKGKRAAKVEYALTRLHKNVTSEHTFWDETRNIDDNMILDWYERMLALRADLTRKWDQPRVAWIANTTPHGPCLGMDGRACEFQPLCARPWDEDTLLLNKYVKEGGYGDISASA
jgi:hypothetical protein